TEVGPGLFQAHFDLGVTLNVVGRAEEAVPALRRAAELKPDDAAPHYNLGNAFLGMDQLDDAIAAYHRAIELAPNYAEAHCNLADALRWKGKFTEARDLMARGHELGSRRPDWRYPSARWVDEYRRLVELDGRLPAILRGDAKPSGAAERNMFAQVCQ